MALRTTKIGVKKKASLSTLEHRDYRIRAVQPTQISIYSKLIFVKVQVTEMKMIKNVISYFETFIYLYILQNIRRFIFRYEFRFENFI